MFILIQKENTYLHHTEELFRLIDTIATKLTVTKEGIMAALVMAVSLIKIHGFMLIAATFNITEREKTAAPFTTT